MNTIFDKYIFENQKGGLSLVQFTKEQQKGGSISCDYKNRLENLVVPAGLVSCNPAKPRFYNQHTMNTTLIGGELFDKLFENISVNKKKNTRKNLKHKCNKTIKIK